MDYLAQYTTYKMLIYKKWKDANISPWSHHNLSHMPKH